MGRQIALAALGAWLILLAALFLHYQFGPFIIDNMAPSYLAASAAVLAVFITAGGLGLKVLGGIPDSPEAVLKGLAVGLALFALIGFAIAALGLMRPFVVYLILAGLAGLSYREIVAMAKALKSAAMAPLDPVEAAFSALVVVALIVGLINCLSPVTANDALVYHLNIPRIYCEAGGMMYLPFNVYANMPHYGEILFTVLYSIAGETGVSLFYFAVLIAASLTACSLVTRRAPRVFGILAAGVFLVQPLVLDHRVVANIDVMLAFIFLAAVGIIVDGDWKGGGRRAAVGLGLLAGLMLGMKYTAVAPALSLLILVLVLRRKDLSAAALGLGIAVGAAVFAPWLVRDALNTGNPFYPMFAGRLGGANWDGVQQARLLAWQKSMGMGRSLVDYLALPINLSTRGRPGLNYVYFDGTISPAFLMLFPLAFVRRRREDITLALVTVGLGLFWALTSQQLRFLLPALGLAAVVGARGLASAGGPEPAGRRRRWVTLVLLAVVLVEVATLAAPNQYGRCWVGDAVGERLGAALGFEPRDRFLERTLQPYALYRQAEADLPVDEPVFMVWENRAYHLGRPYFADSFFEASTLMRIVAAAGDARDLRDTIEDMGYHYVIINDLLGEVFARQYAREDIQKLRRFIDTYLEPVRSTNRVTLYRMNPM